jgi:agmatine deiminase
MKNSFFPVMALFILLTSCEKPEISTQPITQNAVSENNNFRIAATEILYTMPDEAELHEATWLQWPHQFEYGTTYRNRLDATWIAMTKTLVSSEKVYIVAYNTSEKTRITNLLTTAGVALTNVVFKVFQTNDVWVRDNGPIYVRDKNGQLVIQDWGFNGWGEKAKYNYCDVIPTKIAIDQGKTKIDLNAVMKVEGGSVEIDGNGTLLATKSAILNKNRNPNMTQAQAEAIFTKYLGVTNFIWLDGVAGLEITDMHIDGFAKFANKNTLVTMSETDLLYWEVPQTDINKLYLSKNKSGAAYNFVKLPLTKNNVITTYGKNLGYKGSYLNYYIANSRVLVPTYNDPNDNVAIQAIQKLYPTKTVVGIDVRNLYANGGMIHCVTQQQPK